MPSQKIQFHSGEWTREEALKDSRTLYVFTDNTDRTSGRGVIKTSSRYARKYGPGHNYPSRTAAVVRGLDNAYPVSTQRWYHQGATGDAGRWNDADFDEFKAVIDDEFAEIAQAWKSGRYDRVMLPSVDGLVNGHISAITRERTPKLYAYLQEKTTELFKIISPEEAEAMENRDAIDSDCVYVSYVRGSNMPDNAYTVRIFAGNRQGIVTDAQIPVLYPQFATMSGPHKDGRIDDAEYTRRYESQILRPNEKAILSEIARVKAEAAAQGKVPVLLCYCRPGEYCHRYLVSNWLNEHGVASREVPGDRKMYTKGHVVLFGEEGATVIGRQTPEEQVQPDTINIYAGAGEHPELSNFAIHPFRYAFKTKTSEIGPFNFKSVEQAYQYAKTLYSTADKEVLGQLRGRILNTTNGGELRKLGRSTPSFLSEAWDKNSPAIMKNLLLAVYRDNPGARKALLDTGNATLTHTQDNGRWGELFPRLLMEVRDIVRAEMLEKGYVENPEPVFGSIEDEAFKLAGYIEEGKAPKSWKDTFVHVRNYSPAFGEILGSIDINAEKPFGKLAPEERAGIAAALRAKGKQALQEERRRSAITVQSGGARGADEAFGIAVANAGGTVNHWYAGERTENNAPLGNREMSAEDFEEGKTEAAAAARRNWGYEYSSMKDVRLVRDWAQVKYADAVIAVSHIARPGEPVFPSQKKDTRTALVPCVTGGTGYAVGMAILHDKPVYVFDQVDGHWYNWDKEKEDFIQVEKPEYYHNFAGIGSRELTDAGREAINAYVEGVRATLSNSMKEEAQEKKEEQIEVDFSQEKKTYRSEKANEFMTDELKAYIHSEEFKKLHGDWEKGESDLVLDANGEPLVLWHGSPAEFEAFDFSHAGDNTGLIEYTDKKTGEKVVSDSDKTICFTDNRQLAVSYAFLARTNQLSRCRVLLQDIGSLLNNPQGSMLNNIHSKAELIEAVSELRKENDAEMNAVLDKLPDLNGEKPLTSMAEEDRKALAKEVFAVRNRYSEMYDMNRNGGVSNQLNNFIRQKEYLPYFRENFDRLCGNDMTVLTDFGEDFSKYRMNFYGLSHGSGISLFLENETKRMKAAGFRPEPVYLDTLSQGEREEFLRKIDDDLNYCIREYNEDIQKAGFEQGTHLYPVFVKAANPLAHDYKESSFPDKYIPNEKYDTAYIAARQVAKAVADGNDAVIYENVRDPFLGTTYGVFSTDSIVMIDKSMMRKEDLSAKLEPVGTEKKNGMEQKVDNTKILEHYVSYEVLAPGVNLAVDTSMDKSREWFEIVDDNGERLVRAANYVQELREYDSAHFENPVVSPDGSITLDAVAHIVSPEGDVETSEMTHPVKFSAEELQELVANNIETKNNLNMKEDYFSRKENGYYDKKRQEAEEMKAAHPDADPRQYEELFVQIDKAEEEDKLRTLGNQALEQANEAKKNGNDAEFDRLYAESERYMEEADGVEKMSLEEFGLIEKIAAEWNRKVGHAFEELLMHTPDFKQKEIDIDYTIDGVTYQSLSVDWRNGQDNIAESYIKITGVKDGEPFSREVREDEMDSVLCAVTDRELKNSLIAQARGEAAGKEETEKSAAELVAGISAEEKAAVIELVAGQTENPSQKIYDKVYEVVYNDFMAKLRDLEAALSEGGLRLDDVELLDNATNELLDVCGNLSESTRKALFREGNEGVIAALLSRREDLRSRVTVEEEIPEEDTKLAGKYSESLNELHNGILDAAEATENDTEKLAKAFALALNTALNMDYPVEAIEGWALDVIAETDGTDIHDDLEQAYSAVFFSTAEQKAEQMTKALEAGDYNGAERVMRLVDFGKETGADHTIGDVLGRVNEMTAGKSEDERKAVVSRIIEWRKVYDRTRVNPVPDSGAVRIAGAVAAEMVEGTGAFSPEELRHMYGPMTEDNAKELRADILAALKNMELRGETGEGINAQTLNTLDEWMAAQKIVSEGERKTFSASLNSMYRFYRESGDTPSEATDYAVGAYLISHKEADCRKALKEFLGKPEQASEITPLDLLNIYRHHFVPASATARHKDVLALLAAGMERVSHTQGDTPDAEFVQYCCDALVHEAFEEGYTPSEVWRAAAFTPFESQINDRMDEMTPIRSIADEIVRGDGELDRENVKAFCSGLSSRDMYHMKERVIALVLQENPGLALNQRGETERDASRQFDDITGYRESKAHQLETYGVLVYDGREAVNIDVIDTIEDRDVLVYASDRDGVSPGPSLNTWQEHEKLPVAAFDFARMREMGIYPRGRFEMENGIVSEENANVESYREKVLAERDSTEKPFDLSMPYDEVYANVLDVFRTAKENPGKTYRLLFDANLDGMDKGFWFGKDYLKMCVRAKAEVFGEEPAANVRVPLSWAEDGFFVKGEVTLPAKEEKAEVRRDVAAKEEEFRYERYVGRAERDELLKDTYDITGVLAGAGVESMHMPSAVPVEIERGTSLERAGITDVVVEDGEAVPYGRPDNGAEGVESVAYEMHDLTLASVKKLWGNCVDMAAVLENEGAERSIGVRRMAGVLKESVEAGPVAVPEGAVVSVGGKDRPVDGLEIRNGRLAFRWNDDTIPAADMERMARDNRLAALKSLIGRSGAAAEGVTVTVDGKTYPLAGLSVDKAGDIVVSYDDTSMTEDARRTVTLERMQDALHLRVRTGSVTLPEGTSVAVDGKRKPVVSIVTDTRGVLTVRYRDDEAMDAANARADYFDRFARLKRDLRSRAMTARLPEGATVTVDKKRYPLTDVALGEDGKLTFSWKEDGEVKTGTFEKLGYDALQSLLKPLGVKKNDAKWADNIVNALAAGAELPVPEGRDMTIGGQKCSLEGFRIDEGGHVCLRYLADGLPAEEWDEFDVDDLSFDEMKTLVDIVGVEGGENVSEGREAVLADVAFGGLPEDEREKLFAMVDTGDRKDLLLRKLYGSVVLDTPSEEGVSINGGTNTVKGITVNDRGALEICMVNMGMMQTSLFADLDRAAKEAVFTAYGLDKDNAKDADLVGLIAAQSVRMPAVREDGSVVLAAAKDMTEESGLKALPPVEVTVNGAKVSVTGLSFDGRGNLLLESDGGRVKADAVDVQDFEAFASACGVALEEREWGAGILSASLGSLGEKETDRLLDALKVNVSPDFHPEVKYTDAESMDSASLERTLSAFDIKMPTEEELAAKMEEEDRAFRRINDRFELRVEKDRMYLYDNEAGKPVHNGRLASLPAFFRNRALWAREGAGMITGYMIDTDGEKKPFRFNPDTREPKFEYISPRTASRVSPISSESPFQGLAVSSDIIRYDSVKAADEANLMKNIEAADAVLHVIVGPDTPAHAAARSIAKAGSLHVAAPAPGAEGIPCGSDGKMFEIRLDPHRLTDMSHPYTLREITEVAAGFAAFMNGRPDAGLFVTGSTFGDLKGQGFDSLANGIRDNFSGDGEMKNRTAPEMMLMRVLASMLMIAADKDSKFLKGVDPASIMSVSADGCPGDIGEYALHAAIRNSLPAAVCASNGYPVHDPVTGEKTYTNDFNVYRSCYLGDRESFDPEALKKKQNRGPRIKRTYLTDIPEDADVKYAVVKQKDVPALKDLTYDVLKFPQGVILGLEGVEEPMRVAGLSVSDVVDRLKMSGADGYPAQGSPLYDETVFEVGPNGKTRLKEGVTRQQYVQFMYDNAYYPVFKACMESRPTFRSSLKSAISSCLTTSGEGDAEVVVLDGNEMMMALGDCLNDALAEKTVDMETGEILKNGRFAFIMEKADQTNRPAVGFENIGTAAVMGISNLSKQEITARFPLNAATVIKLSPNSSSAHFVKKADFEAAVRDAGITRKIEYPNFKKLGFEQQNALLASYAERVKAGENIVFVVNDSVPEYARETKFLLQRLASEDVSLQWVSSGRKGLEVVSHDDVIENLLLKDGKVIMQGAPKDVRFDAEGNPTEENGVRLYTNMNARAVFNPGEMKSPNYGKEVTVVNGNHKSAEANLKEIAASVDIMICFGGAVSQNAFRGRRPKNVIMVEDIATGAGRNAFKGNYPEWFRDEQNAAELAKAVKHKIYEIYAANPESMDLSGLAIGFDGITSAELAYKGFGGKGAPSEEENKPYKENNVDVSRIEREPEELQGVTNEDLRENYGLSARQEEDRGKAFSHTQIREDTSDLANTEFSTLTDTTPLFGFMKTFWNSLTELSEGEMESLREGFDTEEDVRKRAIGVSSLTFNPDMGFNQEACNAFMDCKETDGDRDYVVVAHPTRNASMTYFDGTPAGRRVGAGDRVEAAHKPMTLENALDRQKAMRSQGLYSKVTEETLRRRAELSRRDYYTSVSSEQTPGLSGRQMLTLMMAGVSSGDIMVLSGAAKDRVVPDWKTLSELLRSYSAVDLRLAQLQEESGKAYEALKKQKNTTEEYLLNRGEILEVLESVAGNAELKDFAAQKKAIKDALKEKHIRYYRDLEKLVEKNAGKRLTVSGGRKAVEAFDDAIKGYVDDKNDAYGKSVQTLEIYESQTRNFFTAEQLEYFSAKADALVDENARKGLSFCDVRNELYPFTRRVTEKMTEAGMEFSFGADGVFSVKTGEEASPKPLFDEEGKLIESEEITELFTRSAALVTTLDAMDPCFFYEGDLSRIQASVKLSVFSGNDATERELSFAKNVVAGTLADNGIVPVVAVPEPLLGQAVRTHGNVERSEGDFRKNASVEMARTLIDDRNSHAVLVSSEGRDESANGELLKRNAENGGVNIYSAKEGKNRKGGRKEKEQKEPNWAYKTSAGLCDVGSVVEEAGNGFPIHPLRDVTNLLTVLFLVGGFSGEKIAELQKQHKEKHPKDDKFPVVEEVAKDSKGVETIAEKVKEMNGVLEKGAGEKTEKEEIAFPNYERVDVLRCGGAIHIFADSGHPDVMKAVCERFEGEAIIHDLRHEPGALKRVSDELHHSSVFVDSPLSSEGDVRFDFSDDGYLDVGMEELQPKVAAETLYFVKGSLYDITDVPAKAFPDWNLLEDGQRAQLLTRADSFFRNVETGWRELLAEIGVTTDIHSSGVHVVVDRAGRNLKVMEGNDTLVHVFVDGTGRVKLDQAGRLIDDSGDENGHAIIDDRLVSHSNGNVRIDDFDKLEDEILTSVRDRFAAPREEEALKERNDRTEGDLHKKRGDGKTVLTEGLERSHEMKTALKKDIEDGRKLVREMEKAINNGIPRYTDKDLADAQKALKAAEKSLADYVAGLGAVPDESNARYMEHRAEVKELAYTVERIGRSIKDKEPMYTEKDVTKARETVKTAEERLASYISHRVLSDRTSYVPLSDDDRAMLFAVADKSRAACLKKENSLARMIASTEKKMAKLNEQIEMFTIIKTEDSYEKLNRDYIELQDKLGTLKVQWRTAVLERLRAEMTLEHIGASDVIGVDGALKQSGTFEVCADNMTFTVKGCKVTDGDISAARKAIEDIRTARNTKEAVASTPLRVKSDIPEAQQARIDAVRAEIADISAKLSEKDRQIAEFEKVEREGKVTDKEGHKNLLKDIAALKAEKDSMENDREAKRKEVKTLLLRARSKNALQEREVPRFDIDSPDARHYGNLVSVPVDGKFLLVTRDCKVLSDPAERIEPIGDGCWYIEYDRQHKNILNGEGKAMLPVNVDSVFASPNRDVNNKIIRVCNKGEFNYLNLETGKLLLTDPDTGAYAGTSYGRAFVNGWASINARESDGEIAFLKDGNGNFVLAKKDAEGKPVIKDGAYVLAEKGEDGVKIPKVNLIDEDGNYLSPGVWFDSVNVVSNEAAAEDARTLAGYIRAAEGPKDWRQLFSKVSGFDAESAKILSPIDPDRKYCISGLPENERLRIADSLEEHARTLGSGTSIRFICADRDGKVLGGGTFDSTNKYVGSKDIHWFVKTTKLAESIETGLKLKTRN